MLVAVLLAAATLGTRPCVADEHGITRVRFAHFGIANGLSQSTVRALAQDTEGYIWLGTQDGVDRFDGHEFRVYRHDASDPTSLSDNHIYAIAADPGGAVLIGTQAGGLDVYQRDRDDFVRYLPAADKPDALAATPVNVISRVDGSRWWISSGAGHLQEFDLPSGRFRAISGERRLDGAIVRALMPWTSKRVVVGTSKGAQVYGEGGEWLANLVPTDRAVLDVFALSSDGRGGIYVGSTQQGMLHFDAEGREVQRWSESGGLAGNDVRSLLLDRRGDLWVGTFTGLSRLSADGGIQTWRRDVARRDGLASNRVHSLLEDREGAVWIGTWLEGANVYVPASELFAEIRADPKDPTALPSNGVIGLRSDPDGSLWLGVQEGGGLVHFDLERGVVGRWVPSRDDPNSLSSDRVQCSARDRQGRLWVGTVGGGLNRMWPDGKGFDHFRHDAADPGSLGGDQIISLLFDRAGTLWIGLQEGGLDALCEGCTSFRHFRNVPTDPTSLPGDTISGLLETRGGELWVGARPGGLARLDRSSGRFERAGSDPSRPGALSSLSVSTIFEDSSGSLWLGTQGGGVNRMIREADGQIRFRAFMRKDGLAADAIGGVIEDDQHRIWAATTAGLSRINPESGLIENFTESSGAQVTGYFVNSVTSLADGRVAFGGLGGVTLFDPRRIEARPVVRMPILTDLRVFEGERMAGERSWQLRRGDDGIRLDLAAGASSFALGFSAMEFADVGAIEYGYRLQPMDRDWVVMDANRHFATYTNLQPGDYVLSLRARYAGGAFSPENRIAIRLEPFWWQTRLARSAYLLAGVALLLALIWMARQRVQERIVAAERIAENEERLKLALWGTGDELWDNDLTDDSLVRQNPLPGLAVNQETEIHGMRTLRQYVHPDDLAQMDAGLMATLRGDTEFLDVTYRTRDLEGNWKWVRSRGRCVRRASDGRVLRMVGTTENISELMEHEQALERMNQDLEQRVGERTQDLSLANESLRRTVEELRRMQRQLVDSEKMAALGSLVAGVAHEINTPLGIAVTAASHLEGETKRLSRSTSEGTLKKSDLEVYQKMALDSTEIILRNLRRADKLVKSFKQVAVDQSSEQNRQVELRSYLDEILTSLRPALKRTQHQVDIDCPPDLILDTFPGALYQIVVNLVMNSLTHGFDSVDRGVIRIAARRDGDHVLLEYRDNGKGMSAETRARMFEPFFTTKRGQGGSGLGMHIVYNLVNQVLRGSIQCETAPGQGVQFTIRFPMVPGEPV